MSESDQPPPPAWEPLTPYGVAAFARASLGRLLLVQLLVALAAGGVVAWFLVHAWLPVVRAAIRQLPAQGEIRDEQLNWVADSVPVKLAGNHFLEFTVDLNHSGQVVRDAQVQVEFGRRDARLISVAGYQVVPYPSGWSIAFNREELDPWWGAREPWLVVCAGAGTMAGLLLAWTVLASLYCLPLRVIAFYENHDLTWGQSWRLAGAALMPGAFFLVASIVWYGLGSMDLIQLAAAFVMHLVIAWAYLVISPFFLPRAAGAEKRRGNPFAARGSGTK